MVSVQVLMHIKYFIDYIYFRKIDLLSLQCSLWFWFLPSKCIGKYRVLNIFQYPFSHTSHWNRHVEIDHNHFIIVCGSSQILLIFLYLHTTLWLTCHSDICRGSLTQHKEGITHQHSRISAKQNETLITDLMRKKPDLHFLLISQL